jgi:hypothetical protein
MTTNKRQTILIMSVAATIILSGIAITSNTLNLATAQVTNGPPPTPTSPCPPGGQVEHWDKIIFSISALKEGNGIVHTIGKIPGQFFNTQLDLKVPDQPGVVANLKLEIIDALANQFTLTPADKIALFNAIQIVDDKYEIVTCGQTGPQGATGPQGETGATGPQGPPGSGGSDTDSINIVTSSATIPTAPWVFHATVHCPSGQILTGGGYFGSDPTNPSGDPSNIMITKNAPAGPSEWDVNGKNLGGPFTLTDYAMCLTP